MMNIQPFTRASLFMMVAVLLAATSVCVPAAGTATPSGKTVMKSTFAYQPPQRGAPQARVGGGTRGIGGDVPELQVLAPDHVGLTTQAQPTLYWYAHSPVTAHIEFALIDEESIDPLLELETGEVKVTGVQHLNLADHNITLSPGIPYQWSVALIMDEDSRSTDVIASGVVELIEPNQEMKSRIDASQGTDLVAAYANEGVWYDALDTISSMIDKSPTDQQLIAIRATLLDQVGLQAVSQK
jgi:hypothetical protein